MRRILLFLLLAIAAATAAAQELVVTAMEAAPMDLSASIHQRNDLNGKPCALVKVRLPMEGAVFEGNVLGEVENKAGEYWVYMSAGTKQMRVKHPRFKAVHIMFADYGIRALESKVTYDLAIEGNMFSGDTHIDLKASVLRNDGQQEELRFSHGDDLRLAFLSPVGGYLAVYLVDEDRQAYCLLPYHGQKEGYYAIEANKAYTFFDAKKAEPARRQYVEEYQLSSSRETVTNKLYIVFSPYQFYKAADHEWDATTPLEGAVALPRQLSEDDFLDWLDRCQRRDKAMNVITKEVTISK